MRELKVLTLEEAVHKMSKKATDALSIKNRGSLEVGNFADIVIFNQDTVYR